MPKIAAIKSLKGTKRFSEVFGKGKKFSTAKMLIAIEFCPKQCLKTNDYIEVGAVVGKKISKKAVVRNRIKRLIRESVRAYLPLLIGEDSDISIKAMIISWKQPISAPSLIGLAEVAGEFVFLMNKARDLLNKISQDSQ